MTLLQRVARPMIAGMFIYGGLDALRHPDPKAPKADTVVGGLSDRLGDQVTTTDIVRVNGAVQVAAGVALAVGVWPRRASLALAASLVPTTLAGHRFWEESDPAARAQQQIQFFKNLAMLGGLILAAADTGGRPSVPWRAKRAVGHAAEHVRDRVPIGA
jgi:putative oxidoreductase